MPNLSFLDLVEEVRERNDPIEVISQYLTLKKSGKNFKGLCPFHPDRTPSFMVNPQKGLWHCFGCGRGGNIFTFLMGIENISFIEAARRLAKRAGIPFESTGFSKEVSERERLYQINQLAAQYYHRILMDSSAGKTALEYLRKRGIDQETIRKFLLGYAPGGWDNLLNFLRNKGIPAELAHRCGLVIPRQGGDGYYDCFRDRIIFPIWNLSDRIAGFGGRTLKESEEVPKYINSPETPVFNKGRILYGLNFAKRQISQSDSALVVEGYVDLISAHQFGFQNAVATLGTALTGEQLRLLKRFTNNIVQAYDADSAGMQATLRAADLFESLEVETKIVVLPKDEDPDKFLRTRGKEQFQKWLEEAMPIVDYRLDIVRGKYDARTREGKLRMLQEFVGILAGIKNKVKLDEYAKKIAEELGASDLTLTQGSIIAEVEKARKRASAPIQDVTGLTPEEEFGRLVPAHLKAERILLSLMLRNDKIIASVKSRISPEEFSDETHRQIAQVIYQRAGDGKRVEGSEIIDELRDEKVATLVAQLSLQEINYANVEKGIEGCIKAIKDFRRKEKLKELRKIAQLIEEGKIDHSDKRFIEYQNLVSQLKGKV